MFVNTWIIYANVNGLRLLYCAERRKRTRRENTAVKPAAVQKNTVKPAAIEIYVRVYYNDYGNHRNNTEETRF